MSKAYERRATDDLQALLATATEAELLGLLHRVAQVLQQLNRALLANPVLPNLPDLSVASWGLNHVTGRLLGSRGIETAEAIDDGLVAPFDAIAKRSIAAFEEDFR